METKRKLKQIFIIETILTVVFALLFLVGIIVVAINKDQFSIYEWLDNLFFYGLIIFCAAAALGFLLEFIKHSKDFKAVKTGQFEEVTGTVVGFVKNQDADSGRQINCVPIIQISGSEKTISLTINTFAKIGETYTFVYLKNTKLGEIKTEK